MVDGAAGDVGVAAVLETSASQPSAIGVIGANEVSGPSRVDVAAAVAGAVGAAVAGAVAPGARGGVRRCLQRRARRAARHVRAPHDAVRTAPARTARTPSAVEAAGS